MKSPLWFEKILKALKAKVPLGGLEIEDLALRFSYFDGKRWELRVQAVPPGVLRGGLVANHAAFLEALRALRGMISLRRERSKHTISVIVSVSFTSVYSQVFSLPPLEGDSLEKAVQLNLQMASPSELSDSYAGWQVVGEDRGRGRLEILSVFANRAAVDAIAGDLLHAGFLPAALESSTLSLARLLRTGIAGFDPAKPSILLHARANGLTFIIVRNGSPYFEYHVSWKDIQGEGREIPFGVFRAALVRSLHQVLNFYGQHWQEPLEDIFVVGGGLNRELAGIIKENFVLVPREPVLAFADAIAPDWFTALGAGLRALIPRRRDTEVNLLSPAAQTEFQNQHTIGFLRFWRVAMPTALAVLLVFFIAASLSLDGIARSLTENPIFRLDPQGERDIQELEANVARFNRSVGAIASLRNEFSFKNPIVKKINGILKAGNIILLHFAFPGFGMQATLTGEAPSEEKIKEVKQAFERDPQFGKVNVPPEAIKVTPSGVTFNADFVIKPQTP